MRLSLILPPVQPEVYPAVGDLPLCRVWRWPGGPALAGGAQAAARHAPHRGGGPALSLCALWITLRVYPVGVSHDQTSARLKGVAVMFSVLGMSYGAVATALRCPGLAAEQGGGLRRGAGGGSGGGRAAPGSRGPRRRSCRRPGGGSDYGPVCGAVAERRHWCRCRARHRPQSGPAAEWGVGDPACVDRRVGGGARSGDPRQ